MKRLFGTITSCCLFIAFGGTPTSAQKPTIPFKQLQTSAQPTATVLASEPDSKIVAGSSSSFAEPALSAAASYSQRGYKPQRVLDSKFLLLNGLHIGLAALDIGFTQRCIASGRCREGNPIMPSSLAGQAAVGSAIVGYGFFISYHMKKNESKAWWLSPMVGIGAHTAGALTGFMNR